MDSQTDASPGVVRSFAKRIGRSVLQTWGGPAIAFGVYLGVVLHYARNIPLLDDYHSVLQVLVRRIEGGSLFDFLFQPHNEHLIPVERAVVGLQYLVLGRVDFVGLILIGNLSLVGIYACWRATFPALRGDPIAQTVAALILFQLRNWESATWALAALSNLPVLFFAWLCVLSICRLPGWRGMVVATAAGIFAAGSQANGLLVFGPTALYLLVAKRWLALACWSTTGTAVAAAAVWIRTIFEPNAAILRGVDLQPWAAIEFFLSFLGSIAPGLDSAIAVGAASCMGIAIILLRLRQRSDAAVLVLFGYLAATAVAAVFARCGGAAPIGVIPRYSIYSSTLLSLLAGCAWGHWRERNAWREAALALSCIGNFFLLDYGRVFLRAQRYGLELLRAAPPVCAPYVFPYQNQAEAILSRALELGLIDIGIEAPPRRPTCAAYTTRVVARELLLPHSTSVGGNIDTAVALGNRVRVIGWAPLHDDSRTRELWLVADPEPLEITTSTVGRPDVAYDQENPQLSLSGFALELRYADPATAEASLSGLCLGFSDGKTALGRIPLHTERCFTEQGTR